MFNQSARFFSSLFENGKHSSANPQHIVLHVFTKQCPLRIGVHLYVQYLHYISDEYQIMDGDKSAIFHTPVSWWCYYYKVKLLILIILCIPSC